MKKYLLLTTGGTIASTAGEQGLAPEAAPPALLRAGSDLSAYYEIDCRNILNLDSSNIQAEEWQLIAAEVYKALPRCDGIVVTHGTDTRAYTASMLTYMLQNLQKPVVLTGSQLPISAPLSDAQANLAAAFAAAEAMLGHVDILVCNAGIAQQKLFTDITPEEWQHMLDVNLTGAFHLCQLALPGMIRRKWGRILTVSSMWGQTGGSCEVHYSAAKAGLIGRTKALAREEGPSGITVNCVAPGVIDTDMMAAFTPADRQALAEETPVGRLGSPQEVARALLFLAGEEAGYITGQVFGVNGGLVI